MAPAYYMMSSRLSRPSKKVRWPAAMLTTVVRMPTIGLPSASKSHAPEETC